MKEITLTEKIIRELRINDGFLERCILLLYENQTDDEQSLKNTIYKNYMGFNRPDSFKLSRMAERLKKGKRLGRKSLKEGRKRLLKYAGQLEVLGALKFIDEYTEEEK